MADKSAEGKGAGAAVPALSLSDGWDSDAQDWADPDLGRLPEDEDMERYLWLFGSY